MASWGRCQARKENLHQGLRLIKNKIEIKNGKMQRMVKESPGR